MPSVVKNQSQLRVPPTPRTAAPFLSAKGNCKPELMTALLLPAAGLPMTMYQGNSYSASLPEAWPIFDVLIVRTACVRRWRRASISLRLAAGLAAAPVCTCCSSMSPNCWLARRVRRRLHRCTHSHRTSSTPSSRPAQTSAICMVCANRNRNTISAIKPITMKVRGLANTRELQ
ncbi:hypothetical protein D3C73_1122260 [compost metagenome]